MPELKQALVMKQSSLLPPVPPEYDELTATCEHCNVTLPIDCFDIGGLDDGELFCNECNRVTKW